MLRFGKNQKARRGRGAPSALAACLVGGLACMLTGVLTGGLAGGALAQETAATQEAETQGAETQVAETAPTAPALSVTLTGFTLVPVLAEDGTPELDEDGNPVMARVALEDSVIVPGDRIHYEITLDNPTPEAATDLSLGAQIAPEVLLDPFTITGPEDMALAWSDAEAPELFRPVFEVVEGETLMLADLDTIRQLRITLPRLASAEAATIAYSVTLR